MNVGSTISQLRERALAYWMARTEQERKYLALGGAVALLALLYLLLIDPAATGRAQLRRALPELRQQAAQMQALAAEANELARQPAPQVAPMTRETLAASLATRGIKPTSLTLTGEYARMQVNDVSFANLMAWLDAQRRENRIAVQEGTVTALAKAGQVDAGLTLRQNLGGAAGGATVAAR
jgi:general secretion pathway protein M